MQFSLVQMASLFFKNINIEQETKCSFHYSKFYDYMIAFKLFRMNFKICSKEKQTIIGDTTKKFSDLLIKTSKRN